MNIPTHDFVTVHQRSLKAPLVDRAQVQRASVSELVRGAVARHLGLSADWEPLRNEVPTRAGVEVASVKLSVRMTVKEAG